MLPFGAMLHRFASTSQFEPPLLFCRSTKIVLALAVSQEDSVGPRAWTLDFLLVGKMNHQTGMSVDLVLVDRALHEGVQSLSARTEASSPSTMTFADFAESMGQHLASRGIPPYCLRFSHCTESYTHVYR